MVSNQNNSEKNCLGQSIIQCNDQKMIYNWYTEVGTQNIRLIPVIYGGTERTLTLCWKIWHLCIFTYKKGIKMPPPWDYWEPWNSMSKNETTNPVRWVCLYTPSSGQSPSA